MSIERSDSEYWTAATKALHRCECTQNEPPTTRASAFTPTTQILKPIDVATVYCNHRPTPNCALAFLFVGGRDILASILFDFDAGFTSIAPCSARAPDGSHRHKFTVPGILFIIVVGKTVARQTDAGALNSNAGSFMWLCPWTHDSLFDGFGGLVMDRLRAQRNRSRQQSSRPPRRNFLR
jgi:hypothetical protein